MSAIQLILVALSAISCDTTASVTQAPRVLDPPDVAPAEDAISPDAGAGEAGAPLSISRGAGWDPLEIPRDEELEFEVEIDVGVLGDLSVGRVSLRTGQEPYVAGLPAPGVAVDSRQKRTVGWIRSQAHGAYLGYELQHELEARHLPQAWPCVLFRDTQAGSENRRRELKLGLQGDKLTALYRHDGHCKGCSNPEHFVESNWVWGKPYHCEKCKRAEHRVWNEAVSREIPPGTIDLLSAVYLARSMIKDGRQEMTFPVIDKQKLWILTVSRGSSKTIETPAGRFTCSLAQLTTKIPPGEPTGAKQKFQGLFGIQGSIKIWMETSTGIPVMISGELPVPVINTLELNIRLASYRGTPTSFSPKR